MERRRCGLARHEVLAILLIVLIVLTVVVFLSKRRHRHGHPVPVKDATQLQQIFKGIDVFSQSSGTPVPSRAIAAALVQTPVSSVDTTANLYSMLIAQNYFSTVLVVGPSEPNSLVIAKTDYDHDAYDPVNGVLWDQSFKADLTTESNTSYAHMPLVGRRLEEHWMTEAAGPATFAILGNRGPKDGIDDPASLTYQIHGSSREWEGNIVWADGHSSLETAFTRERITFADSSGNKLPDNYFAVDDGILGGDIVLSFTLEWTDGEPVLQHD